MGSSKIIAVAMSGGVDSSTVAANLQKQHHDIFGVTMYIHQYSEHSINEAKKVCKHLGIEHFVVDLSDEFHKKVIQVFKNYYQNGLTPNPCAICNRDIKMGLLLRSVIDKGADIMATGHYARNTSAPLMEARNLSKDQSYFLSLVSKINLAKMMFPLGEMASKFETRNIARTVSLHNYAVKDSQDICFIPDRDYKHFLNIPDSPGEIVHIETNTTLREHRGIANYTIGQRKGLGISYKNPLYVIKIDRSNNQVFVGEKQLLQTKTFKIIDTNWLIATEKTFTTYIKLRLTCQKILARIEIDSSNTAVVTLLQDNDTPVTGGQICAAYNNDVVVGAGIIMV